MTAFICTFLFLFLLIIFQVIQDKLKEKGHNLTVMDSFGSVVQGILTLGEENITANSDFRKHGKPDGY